MPSERRGLLLRLRAIAEDAECTAAQLALALLLQRGSIAHVIPGTMSVDRLEEDYPAVNIELSAATIEKVDSLINEHPTLDTWH